MVRDPRTPEIAPSLHRKPKGIAFGLKIVRRSSGSQQRQILPAEEGAAAMTSIIALGHRTQQGQNL